jgi:23S rRNA (pseudouridine1915-N3)-methyltransferase
MKMRLVVVGRASALFAPLIEEYEKRAVRYWPLEVIEVREEPARRNASPEAIRAAEAERLMKHVPLGSELIALTRTGDAWSSRRLAAHLDRLAVQGIAGATFLIGGALGLDDAILRAAKLRMRLSTFTLPHDMARLIMAEQLYRAGTIVRNEPYHKGTD